MEPYDPLKAYNPIKFFSFLYYLILTAYYSPKTNLIFSQL